jgi:hypothetical protein
LVVVAGRREPLAVVRQMQQALRREGFNAI